MTQDAALSLLRQMLGASAMFRDGQWEAVDQATNHGRRLLVVQRTGWGKSVVYFLATKILRDQGSGPTLLISPLLSLMRNQILAAERLGVRAATIHSDNLEEWPAIEAALRENRCDVLLVSPERLGNAAFLQRVLPFIRDRLGLFVVDEAHCISDWGHDFRPDYRRIVQVMHSLPPDVPVLCTTATANDRVIRDVEAQIPRLITLRGPLVRPSLRLFNIRLDGQAERLGWLACFVPQLPGSGIIYCLTVQDTRRVAEWLHHQGILVRPYHADLEAAVRVEAEQLLLENKIKALVATVALGMGFDKPDLGFVIHFQRPGSVVAYYQQVGRAGRAVDSAFGILLNGREDDEISDYFIRTAFPPLEVIQGVLGVVQQGGVWSSDDIGAELNHGRGAIEKAIKLLEVDGAVQREIRGWSRTPNPWTPEVERWQRVTQHRRDELAEMQRYVGHAGCLMEFLARALDDPAATACGKCMNCTRNMRRRSPPRELVTDAVDFLRGDALVLPPRERWPRPTLKQLHNNWPELVESGRGGEPKTIIPAGLRACEDRALCLWGDAGWGPMVARGKYESGQFADELVEATHRLLLEQWKPDPVPGWVCAVPSLKRPELVQVFAQQLAIRAGWPFATVLRKLHPTPPQKEMQNSVQQVRNLLGAFVVDGPVPRGPVLLVDDVVDSGWTLTLLAAMLRKHGSGPVFPFALAKASPRGR